MNSGMTFRVLAAVAVLIWLLVGYVWLFEYKRSQEQSRNDSAGISKAQQQAQSGKQAKPGLSKSQEEKLKSQIETIVAGSKHDPSTDSSRMRSVCTLCGAWNESPSLLAMASQSPEAKPISDAKDPLLFRHLELCGKKGGAVKAVYPDEPEWSKLDPKKRVD